MCCLVNGGLFVVTWHLKHVIQNWLGTKEINCMQNISHKQKNKKAISCWIYYLFRNPTFGSCDESHFGLLGLYFFVLFVFKCIDIGLHNEWKRADIDAYGSKANRWT